MPDHTPAKAAVVLLSGGLDSATCLAIAKSRGFSAHCLTFRYGQRHTAELAAAHRVATSLDTSAVKEMKFDLGTFGGSALTDDALEVPKGRDAADMGVGVPITYVPARNTIFLSFALAYAEVIGAKDIFIGANAIDFSGYPDCRPAFLEAFEHMANLATVAGTTGGGRLTIHAPLLTLTKAQIVEEGTRLGVDYGLTVSCYDADDEGGACGDCDACILRRRGFEEAGIRDVTRYR